MQKQKAGKLSPKRNLIHLFLVAGSFLTLSACGDSSHMLQVASTSSEPQFQSAADAVQEVAFDFDFSALLTKEIDTGLFNDPVLFNDFATQPLAADVMTGTLQAENLDTGEVQTFPWAIRVDEQNFTNVESLNTIAIRPAPYVFSLLLARGNQQYAGSEFHDVRDDTRLAFPMMLRPVIGETLVDVTVVDGLVDFRLNYSANDINAASLFNPDVMISIDNGPQQFFTLDTTTGQSEYMFTNLAPGNHQITMQLFDGGLQVGRSVAGQELVTVTPGLDVVMDIEPLYGEVQFDLFAEGSDAQVEVKVPAEVVDSVEGLANLDAILRVVGPNTPFFETPLTLAPDGVGYNAYATLNQLSYDEVVFELFFFDTARGAEVGSCVQPAVINGLGNAVNCQLVLDRRSSISGSFLAALGVNVFDFNGIPLPGAIVSVDGQDVAITGSDSFSTVGYKKLLLKPGQHVIRAQVGADYGEVEYDATALNVDNINIILGQTISSQPALLEDNFESPQTGTMAPVDYWFGCNGSGFPEVTPNVEGQLFLLSKYFDLTSDWCNGTSVVTMQSFDSPEIMNAGGFKVSVDVTTANDPNSAVSIGIGAEIGFDPNEFDPTLTADAIVTVRDNQLDVAVYDNGALVASSSYLTPFEVRFIDDFTVDVATSSFAPGAPATLAVIINGDPNFAPLINFNWDGGQNHIELRGSAGEIVEGTGPFKIALDNLSISPR